MQVRPEKLDEAGEEGLSLRNLHINAVPLFQGFVLLSI